MPDRIGQCQRDALRDDVANSGTDLNTVDNVTEYNNFIRIFGHLGSITILQKDFVDGN